MSYIQLEIDGVNRGLKFNQMSQILLRQNTDINNVDATAAYALFYAGLRANCYVKKVEPDFTYEETCDWFDLLSEEQISNIKEAYEECIAYIKELPLETKKKLVKKKITGNSV